jgi:branched-chain amino acid transport system ATP-binding protein
LSTLISTEDLSRYFGGIHAVEDVNLHCEEKEILGIIGPNGAGKTTLFNLITGYLRPSRGQVIFDGANINRRNVVDRVKLGIARTFQVTRPFRGLTVFENVLIAYGAPNYSRFAFLKSSAKEEYAQAVRGILRDVGLENAENQISRSLPIGHQRRLEIARALALKARVLLLDEPTSGMSHEEAQEIVSLTRRLRELGLTIMMIEHNMKVALNVCDRIYALNYGSVVAVGKPSEVVSDPKVIEAYLGAGYSATS